MRIAIPAAFTRISMRGNSARTLFIMSATDFSSTTSTVTARDFLPLAFISPLAVGFLLGPAALGGFLAGGIFVGVVFGLLFANAGGLWDNAKKYIEDGAFGGKGSDAHKAGVVGDTVGDPFKDTAGPSINTLLTVVALIATVFAPFIVKYNLPALFGWF